MSIADNGWFLKKTTHGWGTVSHLVAGITEFNGRTWAILRCGGVRHRVRVAPDTFLARRCPECKRAMAKTVADKLKGANKPNDYVESFEWKAGLIGRFGGSGGSGWVKDTLLEYEKAYGRKK